MEYTHAHTQKCIHTHIPRGILISTCEIVIACSVRGKGLWESLVQTLVYQFCQSEGCFFVCCFFYFCYPLIDFFSIPISLSFLFSVFACILFSSVALTLAGAQIGLSHSDEASRQRWGDIKLTGAVKTKRRGERKREKKEQRAEEESKEEMNEGERQGRESDKRKRNIPRGENPHDTKTWWKCLKGMWMLLLFLFIFYFWLVPLRGCPVNGFSTLYVWLLFWYVSERLPANANCQQLKKRN